MDRSRIKDYKYRGKDAQELRRMRTEVTTVLRKSMRDEVMQKRRNIDNDQADDQLSDDLCSKYRPKFELVELERKGQSSNPAIKLEAVKETRKLLSADRNPPINEVINSPMFNILITSLNDDENPTLQFEAAWALTNIASGEATQTLAVVQAGAVQGLIRLLRSPHANICEQAVWALGNIIGDGPDCREYVVTQGFIEPLLAFINPDTPLSFLRNVTWVIVNLCRNKEKPLPDISMIQKLIPSLIYLVHHTDNSVLVDTIWAISYITDMGSSYLQLIIDSEIVPHIVPMLNHTDLKVVASALRAIGNIATGTHHQTQVVVDNGVLKYLPVLLEHNKERIRKEATWLLSNITAGTEAQLQSVIDENLIPKVVYFLEHAEFATKKEAAWCISNLAVSGTRDQVRYLLHCNATVPLCGLLRCNSPETITLLIEECKGLDAIDSLQHHVNKDIYRLAYDVLDTYFPDDEDVQTADESVGTILSEDNSNISTDGGNQNGGFTNSSHNPFNF
ncbi:hypothetical protein GJ496_008444 [Pomphorhynchus laevis]|nr:hypothetical protein GJ496_008444 [Pomphorhynchus laevis]